MFGHCHTDKEKRKLNEECKLNWINTYKDTVTSVCNKRRSIIQGAQRTAVVVFAEKNEHTITSRGAFFATLMSLIPTMCCFSSGIGQSYSVSTCKLAINFGK